nr:bifunctional phosphopantothenoylcysteine decarboxylase/phosphopantothenate synthase [Desulfobacterales bacterium]
MDIEIPILRGKNVVIGVSGGIAAYKAADLASRLVKAGSRVDVVMTPAAVEFVRPLTFQALTRRPVALEMFSLLQEAEIGHVTLGKRADLMIIAPATANTLASGMWAHPATAANMEILLRRGSFSVGPESGRLASGAEGIGRMAEPEAILDAARWVLGRTGPLAGEKVVVTAGGTREAIDPVRFIGNHSSGKMGYALAFAARDRGAEVTLVHGPTALAVPYGVREVAVESAEEMQAAVLDGAAGAAAVIMAAAVADYRPRSAAEHKIKKSRDEMVLELVRTPDILAAIAARRSQGGLPRAVIGFAAETRNVLEHA